MKIPEHMLKKLLEITVLGKLILETEPVKAGWLTCPFCKSKASLNVSEKHRTFHCFSCGEGGNAIKWVMRRHNITSFVKAVDFLVERGERLTSPTLSSPWQYFPAADGGFIGTEDGQTQLCDFREGMGSKYGKTLASALNSLQATASPAPMPAV